jgi:hypothetical protein
VAGTMGSESREPTHPVVRIVLCNSLAIKRHGRVADLYLGRRLIILGAIPPFAIRLHIVLLNETQLCYCIFCFCL